MRGITKEEILKNRYKDDKLIEFCIEQYFADDTELIDSLAVAHLTHGEILSALLYAKEKIEEQDKMLKTYKENEKNG